MWTRIVLPSLALAASLYAGALHAQSPNRPAAATAPGNLLGQVKWLRLEVVGGRLIARAERCSQSRVALENPPETSCRQSLSVESKAHALVVRYEAVDAEGRLALEMSEKGLVTLRRTSPDGRPVVIYTQPAAGKVTLAIGAGKTGKNHSANDLWQLLIVERAACEAHLIPLLERLNPKWCWGEEIDRVEAALTERAGQDVLSELAAWNACIEDLGHADFSRRQAADRTLRAAGQGVLAHLRQVDSAALSGEQRRRISRILAELPDGSVDTPLRVADWLASDKRVWVALLARGDLDQRVAAAQHLSHLCRRPLPFNPQGTADERTAQLAELTLKLVDN